MSEPSPQPAERGPVERVTVERDGPVAWVRYGSPGNHLTARGLLLLRQTVDALLAQDPPRVLVLAGEDGRSLTLVHPREGLTMASLAPPLPAPLLVALVRLGYALLRSSRLLRRWFLDAPALAHRTALLNLLVLQSLLERGQTLTIAALRGPTVGGGMELALCCDLRVAADDPETWLAQPEVLGGVMVGFGASVRLPRLLGAARALDLLLTADPVDARQALAIGLVSRVFSAERFEQEVRALAHRLAARAPAAMLGTTRAVRGGLDRSVIGAQMVELREVLRVWQSPEATSGLSRTAEMVDAEIASGRRRTLPEWLASLEAGTKP